MGLNAYFLLFITLPTRRKQGKQKPFWA